MSSKSELSKFYELARKKVIDNGFSYERDWQEQVLSKKMTEQDLLRESAWVILCSGFREKYVSKIFNYVSLVSGDWESATFIVENKHLIRNLILEVFGNTRKVDAIIDVAEKVNEMGFNTIRSNIENAPIEYLQTFSMIGPITSKHLAKNLGFNIAKNDRHLVKIANSYGYNCVEKFCTKLSGIANESVAVVDITLWRYGVLNLAV